MAYTSGVITGAPQTGFTTPTYTLATDNAPDIRSKQWYVQTIGGTQAGVVAHSINAPFTITVRRPSLFKTIASAFLNGVTGQYSKVPFNENVILARKGAQVATNQWWTNEMRITTKIFAGTESFDSANLKALVSLAFGFCWANSSGHTDTCVTGVQ